MTSVIRQKICLLPLKMLKLQTQVRCTQHVLYPFQIHVPSDNADEAIRLFNGKRIRCRLNENEEFSAALLPDGQGDYFIMLNKNRWKQWNLSDGMAVSITLSHETAEYGMPISDEMGEVLAADPVAMDFFNALTPGKRRSLIYFVSKIKSPQKRIEKSIIIARYLMESKGVLDYKALNRAMKEGI